MSGIKQPGKIRRFPASEGVEFILILRFTFAGASWNANLHSKAAVCNIFQTPAEIQNLRSMSRCYTEIVRGSCIRHRFQMVMEGFPPEIIIKIILDGQICGSHIQNFEEIGIQLHA